MLEYDFKQQHLVDQFTRGKAKMMQITEEENCANIEIQVFLERVVDRSDSSY